MAAGTFHTAVGDTTGSDAQTYPTAAFTPGVGQLVVSAALASGVLVAQPSNMAEADNRGGAYTRLVDQVKGVANADTIAAYVRTALTTSALSHVITLDTSPDAGTGALVAVWSFAGIMKAGAAAIRQFVSNAGAAATTPTAVFGAAVRAGNPVVWMLVNATNAAGVDVSTGGFAGLRDFNTGYATPTQGGAGGHRDSGFTGTTLTFGASASAWGVVAIEIDAQGRAEDARDYGARPTPQRAAVHRSYSWREAASGLLVPNRRPVAV